MRKQIIKDLTRGSYIEKKVIEVTDFKETNINSIEDWLIDLINKGYNTISIINEYDIPEDVI